VLASPALRGTDETRSSAPAPRALPVAPFSNRYAPACVRNATQIAHVIAGQMQHQATPARRSAVAIARIVA
jgi:hypothetical protein